MKIRFTSPWAKLALLTVAASPLFGQIPSVNIDGPTPGATITGTVTVSGWALNNTQTNLGPAIASVVVQVDGTTVGTASQGISRPDVCGQYPARAGCPNVGWAYSLNSATLSAGSHTITVVATDASPVPDLGSSSVQVTVGQQSGQPPAAGAPLVGLDSPTAGANVSGIINVTGWAIDNQTAVGTAISSVQVMVDGVSAGFATYGGIARWDVCQVYPNRPNCPNVGYTFALNTAGYSPGSHVITVVAKDSDTSPDAGTATVNFTVMGQPVSGSAPTVMIDSLTPGEVVSGPIMLSGWAIDNGAFVSTIEIQVDGYPVGVASLGVMRSDVCALYPTVPGCPYVGFQYRLDTSMLPPGTHTVTAVASDNSAIPQKGTWSVNVSVVTPPVVTIESPAVGATVSGTILVSGWAIDGITFSGPGISSVQVSVDGNAVGTATYGQSRLDICNTYPGRVGCPNVGFTFPLNTATLTGGPHTITVTAADASTPAATSASSVTVNVSNSPFSQ